MGFEGNMTKRIVALAGGVGGAKLSDGIARSSSSHTLTVIVNTGDDFYHFGLYISPDLDTVCYNLADIDEQETGWGRRDDSWDTYDEIRRLDGPDWFRLGNKDLATHLERTRRLPHPPATTISNNKKKTLFIFYLLKIYCFF